MKKLFFILSLAITTTLFSQNWETVALLPGRSPIKQIEIIDDNNIYVSSQYYKLHHWNGTEWKSVGDFNPSYNGAFDYRSENEIYATHDDYFDGKNADEYNYIAKWDGNSWSNFGNFNQPKSIHNFKILSNTEAYAVGDFDDIENYRWRSVAKFNGTNWSVVGFGDSKAGTYSGNNSLWVNNENDIYSKHDHYRDAGPQKVKHWNGTNWTVLASSNDEIIGVDRIHVVSENEIYVNTWNRDRDFGVLGKWDGNSWKILGDLQTDIGTGNFYGSVDFLFINSNEIYAFGSALRNRSNYTYQVAVWNGTKWNNLGNLDANNPVTAAFYRDGFLYVGGSFTESGKTLIKKIDTQKVLSTPSFTSVDHLKIFPNPIKDIGHLDKKYQQIKVFSVLDKLLLEKKNTDQINLSELNTGIYLLELTSTKGLKSHQKILKE